jgi:tetratricopeptide (TPR) repeat protein
LTEAGLEEIPLESNSSRVDALAAADRAHLAKSYSEAIDLYHRALAEDSTRIDAWYGLAAASASQFEYADAVAAYRRALELSPDDAGLRINLGEVLFCLGHVSEAVRNYQIAAAAPDAEIREMATRNLACIAPGDPALDDAAVLEMRRTWAAREAALVQPCRRSRAVPSKRLRIAYYGSFFAERNWMKMYMGVLNAHDRDRFEINLIVDGALPSAASGYEDHDDDRTPVASPPPRSTCSSTSTATATNPGCRCSCTDPLRFKSPGTGCTAPPGSRMSTF